MNRPLCIVKYIVLGDGTLLTDVGDIKHVKAETLFSANLVIVDKAGDLEVYKDRLQHPGGTKLTSLSASELVISHVTSIQKSKQEFNTRTRSQRIAKRVANQFSLALEELMSKQFTDPEHWRAACDAVEDATLIQIDKLLG